MGVFLHLNLTESYVSKWFKKLGSYGDHKVNVQISVNGTMSTLTETNP